MPRGAHHRRDTYAGRDEDDAVRLRSCERKRPNRAARFDDVANVEQIVDVTRDSPALLAFDGEFEVVALVRRGGDGIRTDHARAADSKREVEELTGLIGKRQRAAVGRTEAEGLHRGRFFTVVFDAGLAGPSRVQRRADSFLRGG